MSTDNSFFLTPSAQNLASNLSSQTSSSYSQFSQSNNYGTTSIAFMDELIKEYLLFRGFNSTLKAFEHDLKQDKDRSFRADRIIDQLFAYINAYDLVGLLDYWSYLDQKFFSKVTLKLSNYSSASLSRKYEVYLLRYYLINAIQTSKADKAMELFENYASKLQSQSEWKEWYCLPFLKNPEENSIFSVYSNKNWKETFIISLQNFLNIVFQSVTFPRLLNYDEEAFWNKQANQKNQSNIYSNAYFNFEQEYLLNELVDEFQLLQVNQQNRQSNNNSFISLLKNLTTYPNKSSSKLSNSSGHSPISATTSATGADSLNQNLSKILSTKSSAFDYMVKNRALANYKKNMKLNTSSSGEINRENNSTTSPKSENSNRTQALPMPNEFSAITSLPLNTVILPPIKQENDLNSDDGIKETNKSELNISNNSNQNDDKQINSNELKEEIFTNRSLNDNSNRIEPYLVLSQEDYTQHHSAILHCKFSKDGKYVASVDSSSLIKIWSIDNMLNTISSIMQKSSILCLEWDKRFNNILYIGTKSYSVKLYDVYQKKIVQDLTFNKLYPLVTLVYPLATSEKVLILMASRPLSISKNRDIRNGQMVVCNLNNLNFNLTIEKLVDLETFYSQCLTIYQNNLVILGCSDGTARFYYLKNHQFISSENFHSNGPILNLILNRTENILISISTDSAKIWSLPSSDSPTSFSNIPVKLTFLNEIKFNNQMQPIPFYSFDQLIGTNSSASSVDMSNLVELKFLNATNLVKFDSTENYLFTLDKTGVYLKDILLLDNSSSSSPNVVLSDSNTILQLGENFSKQFSLEQASTLEVWNASHSCILIVGSLNGTVRIFKLLHQF